METNNMIIVNGLIIECNITTWAYIKASKALLELGEWQPALFPKADLASLIAERAEVFNNNLGSKASVRDKIDAINLAWRAKDIPLGISVGVVKDVPLETITMILVALEKCLEIDTTEDYKPHLASKYISMFVPLFTIEELEALQA